MSFVTEDHVKKATQRAAQSDYIGLLNAIMAFLTEEEKRIAGDVIKIPINVSLWETKMNAANKHFQEYSTYYFATEAERFGNRFDEHLLGIRKAVFEGMTDAEAFEHWPDVCVHKIFDVQFNVKVLSLFLNSAYQAPRKDLPELANHLSVYKFYLTSCYMFKFFYPTVNEFINFAANKLIYQSMSYMAAIRGIGEQKDRVRPGSQKKKALAEARKERLENLLKRYPDIHSNRKQKQSFIIEAMKMEDVSSSRTIENYLKKLKPKEE